MKKMVGPLVSINRQASNGFTFLELLIAVTIFSISAVAIYSSFNVGIRAWRKAEDSYKVRQEARQALSAMSRELRSALGFKLKKSDEDVEDSLDGSSDEVSFWRALRTADSKEGYPAGIYKATYKVVKEEKKSDKEDGQTQSLCRILRSYRQYVDPVEGEEDPGSVFLSGLSGFKLEYAYADGEEIGWQPAWKDKQGALPFMVKVTLSFPSQGKAGPVDFTETITIPTGELTSQEEEQQP